MPECEIKFDNPREIFYSGEVLSGVIQFNNSKKRSFVSMSIEFRGFAKCYFDSNEGYQNIIEKCEILNRDDKAANYSIASAISSIHQDLEPSTSTALSKKANNEQFELSKGNHEFKFKFDLPLEIPTSVEITNGFVRYLIMFKIARKWKPDYKYEFPVTIIKNLDLNISCPTLQLPFLAEDIKRFEDTEKYIKLSVRSPMTGYIAGQRAKFIVTLNNQSDMTVNNVNVSLIQFTRCFSENRVKEHILDELIKSHDYPGVLEHSSKVIHTHLNIPAVDPSTIDSCKIIVISYEIRISVVINELVDACPTVVIPIVIGTKAFEVIPEEQRTIPNVRRRQQTVSMINVDLPPPSYNEAMNQIGNPITSQLNVNSIYPSLNDSSPPQYSPDFLSNNM